MWVQQEQYRNDPTFVRCDED